MMRDTRVSPKNYLGLFCLALSLFLSSIFFSACTNLFGGSSAPSPTAVPQQALKTLHWCDQPALVFRDEGTNASDSSASIDWSTAEKNLGFTIYLPASLPQGTCLVSALATIHDPIYGNKGNFTVGYLLPDHTSLSFSEAPVKFQDTSFQCSVSTVPTSSSVPIAVTPTASAGSMQLCSGAKNATSIIIGGTGTTEHFQQIFQDLQADIDWMPAS